MRIKGGVSLQDPSAVDDDRAARVLTIPVSVIEPAGPIPLRSRPLQVADRLDMVEVPELIAMGLRDRDDYRAIHETVLLIVGYDRRAQRQMSATFASRPNRRATIARTAPSSIRAPIAAIFPVTR